MQRVLLCLDQPLTPAQIITRTNLYKPRCFESLAVLRSRRCLRYLSETPVGRICWLTQRGRDAQHALFFDLEVQPPEHIVPDIDWNEYGPLTTSHRGAVVRALHGPMQAATIRRRAVAQDRTLKMTVNHTFDALTDLHRRGVVTKTYRPKERYPYYELTRQAQIYQTLLRRAREWRWKW